MAVERKYERDIDLLLAEEFEVSPEFASWFLSQTKFGDLTGEVVEVFVSKSNNLGESDLIVIYSVNGVRKGVLIENKIDAPIQPEQADRYRRRAEIEIQQGAFEDFEVVLCAPQVYADVSPEAATFSRFISYERVAAAIGSFEKSSRGKYREKFVATSAVRSVNKWKREQDDATDAFWEAVYSLASKEFPGLQMKPLTLTKNSNWITIRPRDLPTFPKPVCVYLKGNMGPIGRKRCFVDLTFGRTAVDQFESGVRQLLAEDMTVHQTAAASAIRIELEPYRVEDGVEAALPKVRNTLSAVA